MKRWLSVLVTILLLGTLAIPAQASVPDAAPWTPFADVQGTKYESAVGYLYALGVVSGTSSTTFSPEQQVTRAQMAAFVVRALGKQDAPITAGRSFSDVPRTHWAVGVVSRAAELGIVKGNENGTFSPDAPVTYAQAVTMLLRAINYDQTLTGDYPVAQVTKASELGWLEGVDFRLEAAATRGDIALMLTAAIFKTPDYLTGLTLSQSVHKKASRIEILPSTAFVETGDTAISVVGVDWFGKTFDVTGASVFGKGDGFNVSSDGILHVTSADKVKVYAQIGSSIAEQSYDVLKAIEIKGAPASLKTGASATLNASGTTPSGASVQIQPSWAVTAGPGTINADGVLTSNGSGNIVVRATAGKLHADATISTAADITISPAQVTLAPGQQQKFTAQVRNAAGGVVDTPVVWSLVGGSGTISQDGLLTPGNSSPIKVQAALGDMTAVATVQLLNRLEISPSLATVAKGATAQFSVKALMANGTEVPITPTWTTTGGVGIMGTTGTFLGTFPGTGTAVATYYGLTASAPLTVAGEAATVRVEASRNSVPANGKTPVTITASLVDGRGTVTSGNVDTINFSLSSSNLGTLSAATAKVENGKATVTFTPSEQAGNLIIVASAPGTQLASGSTTISTVVPSIARIRLSAYPPTLAADNASRTQITATLEDTDGAPIKNQSGTPVNITLFTSGTAYGTLDTVNLQIPIASSKATGTFKAGTLVGTTTIGATSLYNTVPVDVQTVVVGPAAKLAIRAGTDPVVADGSQDMLVYAELQDANGYVRTNDNGVTIQLSGTNGTDTLGTRSANTVNGIATFHVTSTRSGDFTLRATAYNNTIAAGQGTISFTAGQPYRLDLSASPSTSFSADGVSKVQLLGKVLDRNNNLVKTATNKVTFSKSSNQGATTMVNDVDVAPVDGVATLELTATIKPGSDTFTAIAAGLLSPGAVTLTSQITGAAYKVQVQPITTTGILAGQSFTVQVKILDSLNNLVTGATGRTVNLVSTSNTAVITPAQQSQAGLVTFTVTDTKVGDPVFTATSPGLVADSVGRAVHINPNVVSSVQMIASPEGLAADGTSSTTITTKATDAYGNLAPWSTAIALTMDNTASGRLNTSYLYAGGQAVLYSTKVPGTIHITGTASGVSVTPLTIQTYVPAAPARVVVEQVAPFPASGPYQSPTTLRVKILDVNGNLATGANSGSNLSAVGLTISGSGGTNTTRLTAGSNSGLPGFSPNGVTMGSTYVSNGVATFQFTNQRAETVFITPVAYYNGQPLVGDGAQITTQAGPAHHIVVNPASLVVTSQAVMPLTIQAFVADQFDNVVTTADDTFTFTPNTSAYLVFPDTLTVPAVDGKASLTVTSKLSTGGGTLITIKSLKTSLSRDITIATDLPPAKPTVQATNVNGSSSVVNVSDGAVKIRVNAMPRQSTQTVLVYVNGRMVATYTGTDLAVPSDGMTVNQGTWTGYVRTTDFAPGTNSVTVILTNGLGLSPVSDPSTVYVQ